MRSFAITICATAILLAGCSGTRRLTGIYKGDIIPTSAASQPTQPSKPGDLGEALGNAFKGFLNGMLGPLTIEFNSDGKYKVSMSVGSETGTYSISGNEVTLTPDNKDQSRKGKIDVGTLILSDDGNRLRAKKEFKSDSDFVLKKQQ